ncbi:hypothetical protein [Roseateles terrae]|uniref:Uncharacterized protein n=1 Tax=Roseateles terrae TaxID=431060 RepID=A0ABR6GPR0_9BURK|nr:hypothetical protein [Roseateles terrae]MBB3193696.1 hypothetical protein [Roseateles terrae]OWQ89145.1 hypothetical protein CDN98_00915 [Roseateles terrae]
MAEGFGLPCEDDPPDRSRSSDCRGASTDAVEVGDPLIDGRRVSPVASSDIRRYGAFDSPGRGVMGTPVPSDVDGRRSRIGKDTAPWDDACAVACERSGKDWVEELSFM